MAITIAWLTTAQWNSGRTTEPPTKPGRIWRLGSKRYGSNRAEVDRNEEQGRPARESHAGCAGYLNLKENRMGLNERRKIKELQETTLPERQKEIEEICGQAIPYEVDWDSLADDAEGLNFLDNISCHRLNMALRTICIDDMGK